MAKTGKSPAHTPAASVAPAPTPAPSPTPSATPSATPTPSPTPIPAPTPVITTPAKIPLLERILSGMESSILAPLKRNSKALWSHKKTVGILGGITFMGAMLYGVFKDPAEELYKGAIQGEKYDNIIYKESHKSKIRNARTEMSLHLDSTYATLIDSKNRAYLDWENEISPDFTSAELETIVIFDGENERTYNIKERMNGTMHGQKAEEYFVKFNQKYQELLQKIRDKKQQNYHEETSNTEQAVTKFIE